MKIYFDMDGVLADFDLAAAPFTDVGFDLNNQAAMLGDVARAAKRARWQRIEQTRDFWTNMAVIDGAPDLVAAAAQCGELFILTRVPGAANFVDGARYVDFIDAEKRAWVARHFGKFFTPQNVIVARGAKEELVRPTASDVLIDDRAANIADWCAAGGRGILFTDAKSAIKDLTSGQF